MHKRGYTKHLSDVPKSLYYLTRIVLSLGQDFLQDIWVNQGVRQVCCISQKFNINIDGRVTEWKFIVDPGIKNKYNINQYNSVCGSSGIIKNNECKFQGQYSSYIKSVWITT